MLSKQMGDTSLHTAAKYGDTKCLTELLVGEPNLNVVNNVRVD